MMSSFLLYGQSQIHYLHTGKGRQWIVALHGYGASGASFGFLEKHVGRKYRMLAIDLPFHGHTSWNEGRVFTIRDLALIIDKLLHTLDNAVKGFTLLGYSMGGKLALSLTQYNVLKISKLVLIAPEGLKPNLWHWLTTQTRAGIRLFRFTMENPAWFFLLLQAASHLKLVHQSLIGFMRHSMRNGKAREDLFNRLTILRKCTPQISAVQAIIGKKRLPVRMLYGQYDQIIPYTESRHLSKDVDKYCRLYIADAGHQLLNEEQATIITRLLTT